MKFAVDRSLDGKKYEKEDIGESLVRVLKYWTMRDKFSGVHPDLKKIGVTGVNVTKERLEFLGCKYDLAKQVSELQERVIKLERQNLTLQSLTEQQGGAIRLLNERLSQLEMNLDNTTKQIELDSLLHRGIYGTRGLFPSNYVENIPQNEEKKIKETKKSVEEVSEFSDDGLSAVAIYDNQATEEGELSFDPEDIITNIEKMDEGWWFGTCHGVKGLFPSNYVEVIPKIPSRQRR